MSLDIRYHCLLERAVGDVSRFEALWTLIFSFLFYLHLALAVQSHKLLHKVCISHSPNPNENAIACQFERLS